MKLQRKSFNACVFHDLKRFWGYQRKRWQHHDVSSFACEVLSQLCDLLLFLGPVATFLVLSPQQLRKTEYICLNLQPPFILAEAL